VTEIESYVVVAFDSKQRAISIEEKLKATKSKYAVTSSYFYDQQECDNALHIKASARS
jgi:glucose-1-phosphate thymidylyltransferase